MHFIYIIYSKSTDRFYVGETDNVSRRLEQHNKRHFKGAYTSKANDWVSKLDIKCNNRSHALSVEKLIKKRKSRKYLENLIKYTELVDKLLERQE